MARGAKTRTHETEAGHEDGAKVHALRPGPEGDGGTSLIPEGAAETSPGAKGEVEEGPRAGPAGLETGSPDGVGAKEGIVTAGGAGVFGAVGPGVETPSSEAGARDAAS